MRVKPDPSLATLAYSAQVRLCPKCGILLNVIGVRGTYYPRLRPLCRLLAAFWGLMTLLGAVQAAVSDSNNASFPTETSASRALCRCPMCGHLHRADMKCCCCPAGAMVKTTATPQMTFCAACPCGRTRSVAAFFWSDPALINKRHSITLSSHRWAWLAQQTPSLRLPHYDQLPRPPRLLGLF